MKFRRVSAIAVAAIAILAAPGTGLGATRDPGPSGIYSIPGGPQHSPLVVVDAVDHGHVLGPRHDRGMQEQPVGPAGVPEKSTLILRIAGRVKISAHKDLSYDGPATVFPLGPYEPGVTPAQLVLKGHFVRGNTGIRGAFYSSACSSPLTLFSDG